MLKLSSIKLFSAYKNLFLQTLKTSSGKGILALFTGNTLSKIILTLGGFFLAKLYGAESLGMYNVFVGYVLILISLSTLKLESIVVLIKEKSKVYQFFSSLLALAVPITLLVFLLIISFHGFSYLQKIPIPIWILCGVATLFYSWNNVHTFLFTKNKQYNIISKGLIIGAFSTITSQGIFYAFDLIDNGLIYGFLVGCIITSIYYFSNSYRHLQKPNYQQFLDTNKEHEKVFKYSFPSGFINVIANNLLPILILYYFTAEQTGIFSLANKILTTPLIMLAASFSNVYFQKATDYNYESKEKLWQLTKKVSFLNFGIILLFLIFINTIGIYLIELVFNKGWEDLDKYILILSIWTLARSAVNPISIILIITEKNQVSLIFNIYLLIVIFLGIYYAAHFGDFVSALLSISILSALGYMILYFYIYRLLKSYQK